LHVTTIGPVADELLSLGAVNVETARQVTDFADIIFIMVPDTPQVEEVLLANRVVPKPYCRENHCRYEFYLSYRN
jgi:2-hydroxy-3-oxopropionate reductase